MNPLADHNFLLSPLGCYLAVHQNTTRWRPAREHPKFLHSWVPPFFSFCDCVSQLLHTEVWGKKGPKSRAVKLPRDKERPGLKWSPNPGLDTAQSRQSNLPPPFDFYSQGSAVGFCFFAVVIVKQPHFEPQKDLDKVEWDWWRKKQCYMTWNPMQSLSKKTPWNSGTFSRSLSLLCATYSSQLPRGKLFFSCLYDWVRICKAALGVYWGQWVGWVVTPVGFHGN